MALRSRFQLLQLSVQQVSPDRAECFLKYNLMVSADCETTSASRIRRYRQSSEALPMSKTPAKAAFALFVVLIAPSALFARASGLEEAGHLESSAAAIAHNCPGNSAFRVRAKRNHHFDATVPAVCEGDQFMERQRNRAGRKRFQ
jgi:hypothetical protein